MDKKTEEQELLIEAIENACIEAFEAGTSKENIMFAVEELFYALES